MRRRKNDSQPPPGRSKKCVEFDRLPKNGPVEQAVLDLVVLRASPIGSHKAGLA